MNKIILNPNYWDCECESSFIHRKGGEDFCEFCGAMEENQPDSRQDEIDQLVEKLLADFKEFLTKKGQK